MFWLALKRYGMSVSGDEAFYTFLYLTRDTFSPWENLALLLQNYYNIEFQGWRRLFVTSMSLSLPGCGLGGRVLYSTQRTTLPGSVEQPLRAGDFADVNWFTGGDGRGAFIPIRRDCRLDSLSSGSTGCMSQGNQETNRYKAAILHSFCFGAIFNMIVLVT